jgi:AcrR family transcriptional regulator
MPQNNKELLLEAAITAIEEGGEAALRVDEVVSAVGVTKPTLYHYFGDRDGLVAAAQAERFRRLMMTGLDEGLEIIRTVESLDEFTASLPAIAAIGSGGMGAERRAARVAVLGSATSRPTLTTEVRAALVLACDQLDEFFRIAKERGLITTDFDSAALAMWWFSTLLGRHLVDVLDDERITAQWEEMAVVALRRVLMDR